MKKILLSLAAASALAAAAAPAAAQHWRDDGQRYERRHGGDTRLNTSYVDSLEWKINNAAREGRISWGEARQLMREFREVQPLAWRVQQGEASRWEQNQLARTVDRIEHAVNSYRGNRRYDERRYDDDRRYGDRRDEHYRYGYRR